MDKVRLGIAARSMGKVPGYADGGVVLPYSIRGIMNKAKTMMEPEPAETMTAKYARQDAERAAKTPPAVQPVAPTAEKPNVVDKINTRNKLLQGLKDGGPVKAGIIRGKGTGTSDSIKGTMPVGSFVMPKDSTDVMVSNGETNFTPEMVQKVGAMALLAMKDATHTPVVEQNKFADGGAVKKLVNGTPPNEEQKKLLAQIPTSGYSPAPVGQRVDSTELGRNVSNAISAIPGAGPAAGAANALFTASRAAPAAVSAASGVLGAVQKVAPVAVPAAGLYGITQASQATPQPIPQPAQSATQNIASQPNNTPATTSIAPQQTPTQPAAAALAAPSAPNNQVTRVGNSYTGAPNITGDISINGKRAVEQQSYPAAQALATLTPTTAPAIEPGGVNYGTGGSTYTQDLARKNAETGASSIFNTTSRQTARDSLKRMDAQDLAGINNQSTQAIAKLNADTSLSNAKLGADTQRQGFGITAQNNQANQQNAAARLGIERTTAGLNNQATQQKISAGQQMQDLQTKLLTAKPEERVGLEANLRALQGDYAKPVQDEYSHFTNETQDGKTGVIYNKRNGQTVGQQQVSAPPQAAAMLKSNPKLAAEFDAKYGAGASARILGQK